MSIVKIKRITVAVLTVTLVFAASRSFSKIVTNVQPDISQEEVRAVVVDDFETEEIKWNVETTPKMLKEEGDNKKRRNPVKHVQLKTVEGGPADLAVEKWAANGKGLQKTKVMGVNFQFKYPGYNSVHLIPEKPLQMPGRSRALSIWVHGRGQDYKLEAWVKDYKDNVHILKFGSVNFVGWQPVKADIPSYIPQDTDSFPQTRTLKLERIILRSAPTASTDNTFFFFDQIKVLTETFEVNFDGEGLEKNFDSAKDDTKEPEKKVDNPK
ncbi:MAG: hypothetical protein KBH06_14460 [Spirochaetes bacterium]|nr:hypothetical protein [Spirochaetota bacterium]MBP9024402.1 hypothetical protein [Spirochaetota bacterium]